MKLYKFLKLTFILMNIFLVSGSILKLDYIFYLDYVVKILIGFFIFKKVDKSQIFYISIALYCTILDSWTSCNQRC